jgi:hypothetical protein
MALSSNVPSITGTILRFSTLQLPLDDSSAANFMALGCHNNTLRVVEEVVMNSSPFTESLQINYSCLGDNLTQFVFLRF